MSCTFFTRAATATTAECSLLPALVAGSSRTVSETDLQECKDKEVPMMEEVDVGRVGCCRADSWRLWENMDNRCTSVRTTAAAADLLLQLLRAKVLI